MGKFDNISDEELIARLREGEVLALDMEDYTRSSFPYS